MSKDQLQELIRARILTRQVSRCGQHRIFAGKGDGQPCVCCGRVIARFEVQYDIELTIDPEAPVDLPMHRDCYDLWRNESLMLQKAHRVAAEPGKGSASAIGTDSDAS